MQAHRKRQSSCVAILIDSNECFHGLFETSLLQYGVDHAVSVVIFSGILTAPLPMPSAKYCTRENLHLWKGLSRKDFMAQFGNAELEKYKVPSAEDMAELEKFEKRGEFARNFNLEDVEDEEEDEEEEVNNTVGGTNIDAMEVME